MSLIPRRRPENLPLGPNFWRDFQRALRAMRHFMALMLEGLYKSKQMRKYVRRYKYCLLETAKMTGNLNEKQMENSL